MKRDNRITWHQNDVTNLDIKGKRIAIIGGTGGICRALSQYLASQGAEITVVGQTFRDVGMSNIQFIKADLSLMTEAKRIATELVPETLDILIFTTGIFAAPQRQETAEGIERDLAVSYLNRYVILQDMASKLGIQHHTSSIKPRVFLMAYPGSGQIGTPDDLNAEQSYKAMAVHMNTVAGNEILVLDGAKRYSNARACKLFCVSSIFINNLLIDHRTES